jgi:predicted DNA-binding transcriptional regulator AlpA
MGVSLKLNRGIGNDPVTVGTSPRDLSLPRYALRRDEAAASLAISPRLFDEWIRQGKMPSGHKIGGVVLWDTQEVREAWYKLRDSDTPAVNPFDGVTA